MNTTKKALLLALLFLAPLLVRAQYDIDTTALYENANKPDYEWIEKAVSSKKSDFYYPKLLKRLQKADTTLTLRQMSAIYYGYCFQKSFNPYANLPQSDEINRLVNLVNPDWKKVIKLADKALKEKPTELSMYYWKYLACAMLYGENDKRSEKVFWQLQSLLAAILSTGDGSQYAPIHLTTVGHSYFLMGISDLTPTSQALGTSASGELCDIFELQPNDAGIETLYFNVEKCIAFWGFGVDTDDEDWELFKQGVNHAIEEQDNAVEEPAQE